MKDLKKFLVILIFILIIIFLITLLLIWPFYTIEKMEVTAYCPCIKCCAEFSDGKTADGTIITKDIKLISAHKRFLFGTKMYIPGYGKAEVHDRGGMIDENRLDILFYVISKDSNLTNLEWSHQKALEWGRRNVKVKVYR